MTGWSEIVTFIDSLLVARFDDSNFDLSSPDLTRDDRASDVLDKSKILIRDHVVHNITDAWLPDVVDALLHSGSTRSEPSQGHGDRTGGLGIGPSGPFSGYTALHHLIEARADEHANQHLRAQTRGVGLTPLR